MTNSHQFDNGRYAIGTGRRIGRRGGIAAIVARLLAMLVGGRNRMRQRRQLRRLDDRLLRDIGVSRRDARREASKPLWRG